MRLPDCRNCCFPQDKLLHPYTSTIKITKRKNKKPDPFHGFNPTRFISKISENGWRKLNKVVFGNDYDRKNGRPPPPSPTTPQNNSPESSSVSSSQFTSLKQYEYDKRNLRKKENLNSLKPHREELNSVVINYHNPAYANKHQMDWYHLCSKSQIERKHKLKKRDLYRHGAISNGNIPTSFSFPFNHNHFRIDYKFNLTANYT